MTYPTDSAAWHALGANTIPILPGAKKPAGSGWGERGDGPCLHSPGSPKLDAGTYASWCRQFPDANTAIFPGSIDATVVDVDRIDLLDAVLEVCGPTDYRTSSPRVGGGVHLWYRGASRTRNAITPGVDVKSTGGYVLVPGSIHPKTGQPYQASPALAAALASGKLDLPRPRTGWREALERLGPSVTEPTAFDLRALADKLVSGRTERTIGQALRAIADGKPFAEKGERESVLFACVARMAKAWPTASEDSIVALFAASARVMEALHDVEIPILDQVRVKWARLADADADAADGRPVVALGGDDHEVLSAIAGALAVRPSTLYRQGGAIVTVDDAIAPATADRIAVELAAAIAFTRDGKPCGVSRELASKVAAKPPALPEIKAERGSPIVRSDGSVVRVRGLDGETGVWCSGWPGLPIVTGSRSDAAAALGRLFRFADADQWESAADAAAWLAHVLTIAARPAIDGPVPTWIYTAPAPGSGKTALARAAGLLGGRCGTIIAPGDLRDEAELARLLDGHAAGPAVVLDNLRGTFASPLLEAVVTGDGMLGVRRLYVGNVRVPWRAVLAVTSNGATIGQDWARRSIPVRVTGRRLDSGRDLASEARDRLDLVEDAAAVVASWLRALEDEEADDESTPLASFAAWSRVVGGALRWATGLDVVALTREPAAAMVAAEDDGRELLDWLEAWLAAKGAAEFTARELWDAPTFYERRAEFASFAAFGRRLGRVSDAARTLAVRVLTGERRYRIRPR